MNFLYNVKNTLSKAVFFIVSMVLVFSVNTSVAEEEGISVATLEAENLLIVLGNSATHNTAFDDNPYIKTAMADIDTANHTVAGYPYEDVAHPVDEPYSGLFRTKCEFSHFAYDDPIIYPNQPGRAALQMYFGNTQTNAYSTYESLLNNGAGTCNGEELDRTAYWVPAMLDAEGNALVPWDIMVAYKNDLFTVDERNTIASVYPDNFQMISGQVEASDSQTDLTGPASDPIITFGCGAPYGGDFSPTIPADCTGEGSDSLQMKVAFPSCWDNDALYQADGSHLSFPMSGFWASDCPASHPVKLPSVMYRVHYKLADNGGSTDGWFLSSDVRYDGSKEIAGTSSHASWIGAWNKDVMAKWVSNCNNVAGAECLEGKIQLGVNELSLQERDKGPYVRQSVAGTELAKLCPSKEWDGRAEDISHCRVD